MICVWLPLSPCSNSRSRRFAAAQEGSWEDIEASLVLSHWLSVISTLPLFTPTRKALGMVVGVPCPSTPVVVIVAVPKSVVVACH